MNLANKLTMIRIFLTVVLITILLFPFYMVNIEFPVLTIGAIAVDTRYLIAAVIFAVFTTRKKAEKTTTAKTFLSFQRMNEIKDIRIIG